MTVNPVPVDVTSPPQSSWKSAWFENAGDQCRTDTTACLVYQFVIKAGAGSSIVIDDPAGTNWTWACDWMNTQFGIGSYADFYLNTYVNGVKTSVRATPDSTVMAMLTSYSFSTTNVHLEFDTSSLADNQNVEIYLHATATTPGVTGGITYANSATLTTTTPETLSREVQSTWVGGISTGDHIAIQKSDLAGNPADTQNTAVSAPSGTTPIELTIRNVGTTDLTNIHVSDAILVGTGAVQDLTCDFSAYGGPSSGVDGGAAVLPSTESFTCTATVTGVVDVHEDVATVTATGNGDVSASNPFWATGVMNLVLEKGLVGDGPFYPGSTVQFTLTPSNDGNQEALSGWSVTDIPPAGLTITGMAGTGYSCDVATATCTSALPLAAGATANPITVTAVVGEGVTGVLHNVAYVSPAGGDTETNPLVVPETTTDTSATSTDNDAQADLTVSPKPAVSVGDYVWLDANKDGIQDATEAGIPGVTLTIARSDGAPVTASDGSGYPSLTTTTDASGQYLFDDLAVLPPGVQYVVTVTPPAGYVPTIPQAPGSTTANDSSTGSATSTDLTTGGASDLTLDFGFIRPAVSVGDYVWLDTNRDGIQDATEAGIPNVTLTIARSDGSPVTSSDGSAYTTTTTTDASGHYLFDDLAVLPAGVHYVVTVTPPAGYAATIPQAPGSTTANDSSTGSATSTDLTTDGASDLTLDFGFVKLVSIGDYVWYDTNRDGQQGSGEPPAAGVTVKLYDSNGTLVKTTITDGSGFYSFTDLEAGAGYTVEFVKPPNTVFTSPNTGADTTDSDADVTTGKVSLIAPTDGTNSATAPDNPTIDAGLIKLVSIGDYVWWDNNRDGQQSSGEPAVPGVTVNLYDGNGVLVKTTSTDANGYYAFTDLFAGATYTVEFVKPAESSFTAQNSGADATDSDADLITGKVLVTAPLSGSNLATPGMADDPTIDAGLVKYNLTLAKALVTTGEVQYNQTVTFTLTPHNAGPSDALPGWSVTEILPDGLVLVSMSGAGYSCSGVTCTASAGLAAGTDGPAITVVATVTVTQGTLHNVAYVTPSPTDGPETNPLVVPGTGTDTDATATDNDAQASVRVTARVLPQTGTTVDGWMIALAGGLLVAGAGALLLGRRRTQ